MFASGSGTNAEEIFKYFGSHPRIQVSLLLSNNPSAYVLERAKSFAIPTRVFSRGIFKDSTEVLHWLRTEKITHVVLAGFLWLIPPYLITAFPGRIINIHPALLPKYGGKGMYGSKVHEAVKNAGDHETGITIHEVDEIYDHGKVLFQGICAVTPEDTPDEIAAKVHRLEYAHYPPVIEKWVLDSN